MKRTPEMLTVAHSWRWPDEPIERERAKERQVRKPAGSVPAKLPEQTDGDTRDHLAKLAGVSGKTYEEINHVQ